MVNAPVSTPWAMGLARQRKFLIMGLPRSAATYLMTLLNAHQKIYCTGEQFNPQARVGVKPSEWDGSCKTIISRDRGPIGFMDAFFVAVAAYSQERVGFKYMLGHISYYFRTIGDKRWLDSEL